MSSITIHLFGRFEVLIDGNRVDEKLFKSKKGCMLMQYLLLRGDEAVPFEKLYEVLWPEERSSNPESALKTLVSRLRVILSGVSKELSSCIITTHGAYCWNPNLHCDVDLLTFESGYSRLKQDWNAFDDQTLAIYKNLVDLYRGDLLPTLANESWVIGRSVQLQSMYRETVYHYLDILKELEQYEEMVIVCRQALEINSFDDKLYVYLMEALVKTNHNNEALMQYKHATKMYYKYLGIAPPKGIQDFYKQIISAGKVLDGNIDAIRKELCTDVETSGAFVCEYVVFREIYNLLVRSHERSDELIFLALVMAVSADNQPISPLELDDVMQEILDVMRTVLRKGDTITQYTASQFALLLPLKKASDGKIVMDRIRNNFYRRRPASTILIKYTFAPIQNNTKSTKAGNRELENK